MRGATWRLGGCVVGLGLALSRAALAQPAKAQEPPVLPAAEETRLETWLGGQRDAFGRACDRRAAITEGARTVVACAEAGLWVIRDEGAGKFVVVGTQDLGGDVIGLFQRDESIWAEISKLEARPVLPSGSSATSDAVLPDAEPPDAASPSPEVPKRRP